MSARGEVIPELAEILREIADKVSAGKANKRDADILRKIAAQAGGDDRQWILKLHRKPGAPRQGRLGVQKRFAVAQAVKAYRDEHGGTLDNAFEVLSKRVGFPGRDTIEKAWKDMAPAFRMTDQNRDVWLFFRGLEAEGKVTMTRRGK